MFQKQISKKFKLTTVIIFLVSGHIFSQVTLPAKPLSSRYLNAHIIDLDTCRADPDHKKNDLVKESNVKSTSYTVNIRSADYFTWEHVGNFRCGTIGFSHPDALSISLLFEPFFLKEGVKVLIYNEKQQVLLGGLSCINNKGSGILPTLFVHSPVIFIEIQVPDTVLNYGEITISKVFIQRKKKDIRSAYRSLCANEIPCYNLPVVEKAKNAVCRISTDGAQDCTGTLVNNTKDDGKAYILTAFHCISNQEQANRSVFVFRDEKVSCDCEINLPVKSIAGANYIAGSKNYDFSLLELSVKPDSSFNPLYLGINISNKENDNVSCIHHMNGGDKRLAVDLNKTSQSSFTDVVDYFAENGHWHIKRWDIGTTGGGSSGAPLLDKYGNIIGILSGGAANCENPAHDYFAIIKNAWDADPRTTKQLKHWLDPNNEIQYKLGPFKPYGDINLNISDTCTKNTEPVGDLYFYPSPFQQNIILYSDYSEGTLLHIDIIDLAGRTVHRYEQIFQPGDNIIDLHRLNNGFYFFRVNEKNKVFKIYKN